MTIKKSEDRGQKPVKVKHLFSLFRLAMFYSSYSELQPVPSMTGTPNSPLSDILWITL